VSHSEVTDGGGDGALADADVDTLHDPDGRRDTTPVPEPATGRQPTGDGAVDDALAQLDEVVGEPLDTQIEVGERVHTVLQGRLADLGKE